MTSNDLLADSWEWRGPGKVKRGQKWYMRTSGENIKYVGPPGRGDKTLVCDGGYLHLKLAVLTYYEEEIRSMLTARNHEIRRNVG